MKFEVGVQVWFIEIRYCLRMELDNYSSFNCLKRIDLKLSPIGR